MQLVFDRGTLLLRGSWPEAGNLPGVLWDPRVGAWRSPAICYGALRRELAMQFPDFQDQVCPRLAVPQAALCPELRPYQAAAVAAWEVAGRRGIIVLPTGSGKTGPPSRRLREPGSERFASSQRAF